MLARFRQWLDAQADIVLPKSPIGAAVGYARARSTALTRYCEDGTLAIDAVRFARRHEAVEDRGAVAPGIAPTERPVVSPRGDRSDRALGDVVVDPWAYLRDVFDRIPTHPNRRRAELLPRQWKAAQAETPA